jgi:hypothetical protein
MVHRIPVHGPICAAVDAVDVGEGGIPMTGVWKPNATVMLPWQGGRPKGSRKLMLIDEPPDPVWDGMPRADFLRFAAHIRWTADMMGLRDWRLGLKWEPSGSDCWARIEVINNIETANIWLFEGFAALPEWEQRRAICHELVHIFLDHLTEVGDEQCKSYLGLVAYEMLGSEMHRAIEQTTERIARNWSQTLESIPDKLTVDDDIYIRLQDGTEKPIGEYLGLTGVKE